MLEFIDLQKVENCKLFLANCIADSKSFNLIQNMPIFINLIIIFFIKNLQNKKCFPQNLIQDSRFKIFIHTKSRFSLRFSKAEEQWVDMYSTNSSGFEIKNPVKGIADYTVFV